MSLADVAKRPEVTRQSLQKRQMPLPGQGGLLRFDEAAVAIMEAMHPKGANLRKGRFDVEMACKWLNAGKPARQRWPCFWRD